MNKKTKLKFFLTLILAGTPCVAQDNSDEKKQEMRARNFADFLLYWSEWDAFMDVGYTAKKRAEREAYTDALQKIPGLVNDSTYYANEIVNGAHIINDKYELNQKPDMAYFMFEIRDCYNNKHSDKNSDTYILGKNLDEYTQVLKKLKLARYTVSINKK